MVYPLLILQSPVTISESHEGLSFDTGIVPNNVTIQSVSELASIQQGIDRINKGKSPPFKVLSNHQKLLPVS